MSEVSYNKNLLEMGKRTKGQRGETAFSKKTCSLNKFTCLHWSFIELLTKLSFGTTSFENCDRLQKLFQLDVNGGKNCGGKDDFATD